MSSEQKTVERFQKLEAMLMETDLPDEHKRQLFTLLKEYHNIFSLEDGERGETDLVVLHIDTADTPPSRQRARRMPFAVRKEVAKQLKMMQKLDVIQPSCSPWASPVVLVRKKDGSHRFCVDYRELNSVTRLDSYPLPRIDDLLDQLDQAHYFTTLDLASGYWQIRVHRDSVPKTAFTTPHGLFEFRVMPFGLTNAPSVFQRLMQTVLAGLNPIDGPSFVSVYIDDVLVYSRTMEEHLVHLRNVLERLQKAGLKLKPNKCHFVQKEVEYLGHLLTPHGLSTNSRLVTAVKEFPVPLNVKETRRFLGLSSFYCRFIPFFARVAQPLHQLTKKGARFEWTDACQTAFETLKTKLCEAPVLCFPSFQRDFDLETDASIDGIGAVLSQTQEDGCRHPVAYASRSLSTAERNYAITDLETLAVVWALTHFRCYLYGHAVTVYTDHSAVRAVLETPSPSGRHARWWTRVYGSGIKSIKIVYRPGKSNMNADALSRCPVAKAPAEGVAESELQVAAIQSQPTQPDMNIPALLASDPVVVQSESILSAQRRDTELLAIVKYLENKQLPSEAEHARRIVLQSPLFSVIDGILYFIDIRKGGHQRTVVPRHLRSQLMEEHHKGPMGSHFSGNKLFKTMSHHWWWPGMHKDLVQFARNCPECVIVSGGGHLCKPPLHPIEVQRPFQIVGVDIMDLPLTKRGNRHVLVFQDYFSKWPMVYAIPDQKSWRIAQILCEDIIPMFGVPEALLSDRGANLISHLMMDLCTVLGIKKLNTTAYHPQCNGMVERMNRTLKTMLRKHAGKFGLQWDQYLPGVLWAYRNMPHDSTGEKPSFLLFGMDLRTPSEAALFPPSRLEPTMVENYREELITSLSSARELAAKHLKRKQQQSKEHYDNTIRTRDFRKGNWVLVRFPSDETGRNRKLSQPWHGPYRILDLTDTNATVEKVYRTKDSRVHVHLSRVAFFPQHMPPGYYWYGRNHCCPGKPPQWVESLSSSHENDSNTANTNDREHSCDQNDPDNAALLPDVPDSRSCSSPRLEDDRSQLPKKQVSSHSSEELSEHDGMPQSVSVHHESATSAKRQHLTHCKENIQRQLLNQPGMISKGEGEDQFSNEMVVVMTQAEEVYEPDDHSPNRSVKYSGGLDTAATHVPSHESHSNVVDDNFQRRSNSMADGETPHTIVTTPHGSTEQCAGRDKPQSTRKYELRKKVKPPDRWGGPIVKSKTLCDSVEEHGQARGRAF